MSESQGRDKIYNFGGVLLIAALPFFLMFVAPLVIYGGRINVLTVTAIYELTPSEMAKTLAVVFVWGALVLVTGWVIKKIFASSAETSTAIWSYRTHVRWVFILAGISAPIFVIHQLVIFPRAVENLVHLTASMIYWAMGLGICALVRGKDSDPPRRVILLAIIVLFLFGLAAVIPLILGKSVGAAQASLAAFAAILVVRVSTKVRIAMAALLAVAACSAMVIKTPVRQLIYDGMVFQRLEVERLSWDQISRVWKTLGRGSFNINEIRGLFSSDFRQFSQYDQNFSHIILPDRLRDTFIYNAVGRATHRLNHLSHLGHVVKQTPEEKPFLGAQTYAPLLGVVIPRFIWRNKPTTSYGNTFGRSYGFLAEYDDKTSQNFDTVTEAWMSGGWPAVILSALGWGFLLGGLVVWFGRGGDQNIRVIVALTLAQQAVSFESETALAAGGLLQSLIVIGIIFLAYRGSQVVYREIKRAHAT